MWERLLDIRGEALIKLEAIRDAGVKNSLDTELVLTAPSKKTNLTKFINDYLYNVRRRAGQKIIDKKGAAEMMDRITSEGATLCFIADQDAGRKGMFVDFFGRKASTYKSIALLAATNNIPICVAYSRREDNRFFFEIGINRIIFPEEWKDKDDPIKWITAEYTKAIEEFVRQDPSQYWWLHRRWKHRPKGEE